MPSKGKLTCRGGSRPMFEHLERCQYKHGESSPADLCGSALAVFSLLATLIILLQRGPANPRTAVFLADLRWTFRKGLGRRAVPGDVHGGSPHPARGGAYARRASGRLRCWCRLTASELPPVLKTSSIANPKFHLFSVPEANKWLWVKTNRIPFWLVGEFTTRFLH